MTVLVSAIAVLAALLIVAQLFALRPSRPSRTWRTSVAWSTRLPRDTTRWTAAAVVVGFGLRLTWVLWATVMPATPVSDTGKYLFAALDLVRGDLPTNHTIGGPSAGEAIGYPALLAPFIWLTQHLGLASPAFTAALVNLAAGTLSIVLLAAVTRRWLGGTAAAVAAWLLAVYPGQIFVTSAALSETVFTTLLLGGIWAGTRLADRPQTRGRSWVAFGAFVGLATLTNGGGIMLLAVPVLTRRTQGARWRESLVRPGCVLLGLVTLLVPWMIRNGVQAGVWTPMPTSNAMAICVGNWEGADGSGYLSGNDVVSHCFTGQPAAPGTTAEENFLAWLEDPDEADWYYRNNRRAVAYALSHPLDELGLIGPKLWATMASEEDTLGAAQDLGNHHLGSEDTIHVLLVLANVYHWAIVTASVAGLLLVRAVRRASPVWAVALLNLAGVIVFHGHGRYHLAALAVLSYAAAGALVALVALVARRPTPTTEPTPATPVGILRR